MHFLSSSQPMLDIPHMRTGIQMWSSPSLPLHPSHKSPWYQVIECAIVHFLSVYEVSSYHVYFKHGQILLGFTNKNWTVYQKKWMYKHMHVLQVSPLLPFQITSYWNYLFVMKCHTFFSIHVYNLPVLNLSLDRCWVQNHCPLCWFTWWNVFMSKCILLPFS